METFANDVYAHRLKRAGELAAEAGLTGLIIATGPDLLYLTGAELDSHERLTALVIPAAGKPAIIVPKVDRGDVFRSPIGELDVEVVGWADGENPHELVARRIGARSQEPKVAVSYNLPAGHLLEFQALLGGETVLANLVLKDLFMAKDGEEIEQLRRAGAAIDAVHAKVPELLRAGRTEREVADDIDRLIRETHDAMDFIIVGSGPNGANPHHDFSDRALEAGDVVVVDIGGVLGVGYHSDSTRTYVVPGADPAPDAVEAYQVLQAAQEHTVQAIRPGMTAAEVDALCRKEIADAGYGEYFFHRTGHGIGLSMHEEPWIIADNDLELSPGMTFSVEPGIYVEGKWGMRIEDIVLVTEDGVERLNNQPRDLI